MITNIKDVVYNAKYFWDLKYNPNATIQNALPNCTTLSYGMIIADGKLPPVKVIKNASEWDTVLTNGWTCIEYDKDRLEVGDIILWKKKGHVSVVSRITDDKIIISGSFYTGEHGKSIYEGSYDTRYSFTSLEQLSDFMLANYEKRYFHCWDIDEENRWVGGLPDSILKHPLYSVEEDTTRDQIEVMTFEQNVRNKNNEILKKAEKGFYNVLSQLEKNGYLWYEVEKNKYIAHIDGRVRFIPKKDEDELERLKKENKELKKEIKELKEKMKEIHSLSEV